VPRSRIKSLVVRAFRKILRAKPPPRTNADPDLRGLRRAALGLFVRGHKVRRPRRTAKPDLPSAFWTVINSQITVAVSVFNASGRKATGHIRGYHILTAALGLAYCQAADPKFPLTDGR
jgi:hypothetical protein